MLKRQPLKLAENRVSRLYTGGFLLDSFLGKRRKSDGHFPEDWIGSTVIASNRAQDQKDQEGLSDVLTLEGKKQSLKSILLQEAEDLLGIEHYQKYGSNPGVLVKLLDSSMRLPIQVHPSKTLAKKYFNSPFGKTEAWLVIATRNIDGVEPFILLGFREGISREIFSDMIKSNNSEALEQCLHRIPVKEGDVYLIEAGVPHAIGPGNLILEIQEPTDITLRAEKNVGAVIIGEEVAFQGLSLQEYLDCYNFESLSITNVLEKYRMLSRVIKDLPGYSKEQWLISYADTSNFELRSIVIVSSWEMEGDRGFHILIIINGTGNLSGPGFSQAINKGDYFFIPCHQSYQINNLGVLPLQAITCWPPKLE